MLETALDQLRFGLALMSGRRFPLAALDRLVDAAVATLHEFGAIGDQGEETLRGPTLDESTRRAVQARRFRQQAVRASRETRYYAALFQRLDLDPARLTEDDIAAIPRTPKEHLRDDPCAFIPASARPAALHMTTGTTGRPTRVYFSAYEMRVIVALSTLGALFEHLISPDDIAQISTSSRATLGNASFSGTCARIGAMAYLAGLVDPRHALAMLSERRHLPGKKERTSILSTYPSYLGRMVECGLRQGYVPQDFGLEKVFVGGEIVTEGLRRRCRALFGEAAVIPSFGMTETYPLGASPCEEGHLHWEPSHALVEVCDPETGSPSAPGEVGTMVVTPFMPFRDTTLLLRYDTQDMVHAVPVPLTCSRRDIPATSDLLGKLRLAVRHDVGWTFPRDVMEALEDVEAIPLPARFGFEAAPGGVAVEAVVRQDGAGVRRSVGDALEARGVPLRELHLLTDPGSLCRPYPLRGDLAEASFTLPPMEEGMTR